MNRDDETGIHFELIKGDRSPLPEKISLQERIVWDEDGDLEASKSQKFPEQTFDQFLEKSCVQIFEMFIDDNIIKLLVKETQKYSLFKNCPDPQVTADEIRVFIAILILSGYDPKPSKRHFWDNTNGVDEYERLFGKCTAPFMSMLAELPHPEYPYKFYLDNLFMSVDLLNFLRLKGYGKNGTFRENRVPKTCPLANKNTMQKKDRGSYVSAIDKDHAV
ncbi:hypothetical protein NQ314_004730 [Rhamnusium bicolor]|uniref:PiggyBac transposable element-derived protein domain-containing protein n=1 Tax=Rhamnusium bicolor TaxID=1586634 RepID=A0AAV8ZIR8_9CUCU|nr:hypothetical protein NQ314_004730 [Rhamnusium bicolor]